MTETEKTKVAVSAHATRIFFCTILALGTGKTLIFSED